MGFFDKLKKITTNLFSGFSEADEAFFEELEETLILADLGMDTALDAVEKLRTRVRKEKLQDQEAVKAALRDILAEEMDVGGTELDLSTRPAVVLFIGVNGVGKTTSIGKLAHQLKSEGKRVLLYNLEMTNKQMYERLVSRQSGIMMNRIRQGKAFLGDEKERFQKANTELKRLDVWISSGVKSVGEIRRECQHMGADCIIIDYLQLIKAERHYANRASEVGDISKAIKSLAMELNRPIIVLSQLNRASEGRQTKEPTMSELRESGDIEQDASVVMLLWNLSEENERYKGVKVEKNRQGKTAKFQMEFVGEEMSFKEVEGKDFDFKPAKEKTPFD